MATWTRAVLGSALMAASASCTSHSLIGVGPTVDHDGRVGARAHISVAFGVQDSGPHDSGPAAFSRSGAIGLQLHRREHVADPELAAHTGVEMAATAATWRAAWGLKLTHVLVGEPATGPGLAVSFAQVFPGRDHSWRAVGIGLECDLLLTRGAGRRARGECAVPVTLATGRPPLDPGDKSAPDRRPAAIALPGRSEQDSRHGTDAHRKRQHW